MSNKTEEKKIQENELALAGLAATAVAAGVHTLLHHAASEFVKHTHEKIKKNLRARRLRKTHARLETHAKKILGKLDIDRSAPVPATHRLPPPKVKKIRHAGDIYAGIKEDAPTNCMGTSSSTKGPINTFDPMLGKKKKVLKRFGAVAKG